MEGVLCGVETGNRRSFSRELRKSLHSEIGEGIRAEKEVRSCLEEDDACGGGTPPRDNMA